MDRVKKIAVVFNGFIHDFMTGYWLSALIAIHLLHGYRLEAQQLAGTLAQIERFFFWNSIGAAVAIFATGGMRSFTYVDNFYGAETERTRRRMLVIKHVVLFVVVGGGSYWGYCTAFS
ncbi:hypothetical protein [Geomonas anaerohicana]|uniref:Uncharacterized protein n=1 Tax=Geomonas anaerohicana TaxID=2798583 RepID=A0ABS0YIT9_9BACT|nr:hypothetical protein [Geomonas anaerohicana]MBJ6752221.1 hypothetical protein [Geomonas anaerohicana]